MQRHLRLDLLWFAPLQKSSQLASSLLIFAFFDRPRNQTRPLALQQAQRKCRSSSATFSTIVSGVSIQHAPQKSHQSATNAARWSTSSPSSTKPTSYVALLRKQEATVWCDRSQDIDPRTAGAQKAAKQRATLDMHNDGPEISRRTRKIGLGSMVGKTRDGGVPTAPEYAPANLSGAGVPVSYCKINKV